MAAPALDVNWEAVEAHAVTHGVREAARAFDINENTVMARARRYNWLEPIREARAMALPASMQPIARDARKPASAARSTLEKYNQGGKLALAKTVRKTAVHLSRMKPAALVERVPAIAGLASAHAKLFPEQTASGPLVSIQLLTAPLVEHSDSAPAKAVEQAPMLDLPE